MMVLARIMKTLAGIICKNMLLIFKRIRYFGKSRIWIELERNNEPEESPAWHILFRKSDDNRYNLKVIAEEQILIMEKMKNHGMIVDEQEKEIINYNTITARYRSDRWGLHWSW